MEVRRADGRDAAWVVGQLSLPEVRYWSKGVRYSDQSVQASMESPNRLFLIAESDGTKSGLLAATLQAEGVAWLDCLTGDAATVKALLQKARVSSNERRLRALGTLVRIDREGLCGALERAGFRPGHRYVRLEAELPPGATLLLPRPKMPEGVALRPLGRGDAKVVFSLLRSEPALSMGPMWEYSQDGLESRLCTNEMLAFGAFQGEACIGLVLGSASDELAVMNTIFASPDARGRGLGNNLGLVFLHELIRRRVRCVYGFVRADDDALIRQYELRGAKRRDIYTFYQWRR